MIDASKPDSFELSDYVGMLRRRWAMIGAFTCLGALAAGAYLVVAHKTYTATSTVYVNANAANTSQLLGAKNTSVVNMDDEAQIVLSNTVADLVGRQVYTKLSSPALLKQVTVTVPPNTQVMQISCSLHKAKNAAACAEDFASDYLNVRQSEAQAKIASEISALQNKLTRLEKQALTYQGKLNTARSGSAAAATLHADLENVSSQLSPLRAEIASLGASNNVNAGQILTKAAVPSSPSSPKPLLYGPSGLMAGLLLGLILAFAADRRDHRIHAAADVERFLELPVLFAPGARTLGPLTAIAPPGSLAKRAFGELARSVAATLGDGNHVLLIVGTAAGPGTSVIAANLAATLARTRTDVMLICASQLDPVSAELLGAPPGGRGLAEILAGGAAPADIALRHADIPRLRLITPGQAVATAMDDLPYHAVRRMIGELRRETGYVIVAGTADGADGDIFGMAEFADAAILVTETGRTTREQIAECIRRLARVRTEVLGAAVLPPLGRAGRPASKRKSAPPRDDAFQAGPLPADALPASAPPANALPAGPLPPSAFPSSVPPSGRATRGNSAEFAHSGSQSILELPPPVARAAALRSDDKPSADEHLLASSAQELADTPSEPRRASHSWPLPRGPVATAEGDDDDGGGEPDRNGAALGKGYVRRHQSDQGSRDS